MRIFNGAHIPFAGAFLVFALGFVCFHWKGRGQQ